MEALPGGGTARVKADRQEARQVELRSSQQLIPLIPQLELALYN
jgi:hypothetical protein